MFTFQQSPMNTTTTAIDALPEKCPNTQFFLVRIQSEYRKMRTRKNSVFGHFSRSDEVGKSNFYLTKIHRS